MLSIRFSRKGKKKQPLYRIIICEKHKDPWGDYLENLGTYNPRTKEASLKADRINYWIGKGAQPSDSIWNLLIEKGVIEGKKRTSTKISKKRAAKADEAKKETGEKDAIKQATKDDEKEEKAEEVKKEEKKEATSADKEVKEEKKPEEVKKAEKEDTSPAVDTSEEKPDEEVKPEESKEEKKVEENK